MPLTTFADVFVTVKVEAAVVPPTVALQKVNPVPSGHPGGGGGAVRVIFGVPAACVLRPVPNKIPNTTAANAQTTSTRLTRLSRPLIIQLVRRIGFAGAPSGLRRKRAMISAARRACLVVSWL